MMIHESLDQLGLGQHHGYDLRGEFTGHLEGNGWGYILFDIETGNIVGRTFESDVEETILIFLAPHAEGDHGVIEMYLKGKGLALIELVRCYGVLDDSADRHGVTGCTGCTGSSGVRPARYCDPLGYSFMVYI